MIFYKDKHFIFQVTECEQVMGNMGWEANITYVCNGQEFKKTVPCYELCDLDEQTSSDLIDRVIPKQEAESDLLAGVGK